MARYSLDEVKRLKICPVLYEREWDYSKNKIDDTFLYGIKEMYRWYYRRSNQISQEVLISHINKHAINKNKSFELKNKLEQAFRHYHNDMFYQTCEIPFYQKEIDIKLGEKHHLINYHIPCFTRRNNKLFFINYEHGKCDENIFLNKYEIYLQAIWSFYNLNEEPIFINLYFNELAERIEEQIFKVDTNYILYAKKRIYELSKRLEKGDIPSIDICINCIRRKECPIMTKGKRKQKKLPGK